MFSEAVVSIDPLTADYAFVLTQIVFRLYQKYLGENLIDENLHHFHNASLYQKDAITAMKADNPDGYISFLNKAYEEYKEIDS